MVEHYHYNCILWLCPLCRSRSSKFQSCNTQNHYLNCNNSNIQNVFSILGLIFLLFITNLLKKVQALSLASLWLVRSSGCILSERCNHITPCNDEFLGLITTPFTDVVEQYFDSLTHIGYQFYINSFCLLTLLMDQYFAPCLYAIKNYPNKSMDWLTVNRETWQALALFTEQCTS